MPAARTILWRHRSESLIPEECSVEELESGEMKAICTPEGKEYVYRVSSLGGRGKASTPLSRETRLTVLTVSVVCPREHVRLTERRGIL